MQNKFCSLPLISIHFLWQAPSSIFSDIFLSSHQHHNSLGEAKAVSWLQSGNAEELASVEKVEKLQKFIFQQNNSPQAV